MKRALVTGGSGAIGSAICRRLASCSHHVVIHAHRHPERAAALADEIREYLAGQLSRVKMPRQIDFREALPRELTGKLYKRLLRDEYKAAYEVAQTKG